MTNVQGVVTSPFLLLLDGAHGTTGVMRDRHDVAGARLEARDRGDTVSVRFGQGGRDGDGTPAADADGLAEGNGRSDEAGENGGSVHLVLHELELHGGKLRVLDHDELDVLPGARAIDHHAAQGERRVGATLGVGDGGRGRVAGMADAGQQPGRARARDHDEVVLPGAGIGAEVVDHSEDRGQVARQPRERVDHLPIGEGDGRLHEADEGSDGIEGENGTHEILQRHQYFDLFRG